MRSRLQFLMLLSSLTLLSTVPVAAQQIQVGYSLRQDLAQVVDRRNSVEVTQSLQEGVSGKNIIPLGPESPDFRLTGTPFGVNNPGQPFEYQILNNLTTTVSRTDSLSLSVFGNTSTQRTVVTPSILGFGVNGTFSR